MRGSILAKFVKERENTMNAQKSTQIRYYVSRKNPLTWLSVLMAVGAFVLQILALCFGEAGVISTVNVWFQKVLPMAVALGIAEIVIVRGPKEYYRITKPIFWGCVYFAQIALDWHLRIAADPSLTASVGGAYSLFQYKRYVAVCWILYLAFYAIYRLFVTGKFRQVFVLQLISLLPFGVLLYDFVAECGKIPTYELFDKLSNVLLAGALTAATLAMRMFCDGKYHRTWGDRADGRRLRSINGMFLVAGYIMPDRNDACNSIHDTLEISAVERYIHKKRAEGLKDFGLMHVFLAAYVRCVAKYPALNRFFSGQRIHQRDEDIAFTMTIKKEMRVDGEETTIKLHLSPYDTAEDVYRKLNAVVENVKNTPLDSSFDKLAGFLAGIPGLLLKFVVWCLKVADYFGKLPKALTELSPFHGSVIFTSMGSLGIPPIVHHLYNFGNLPVFVAFGRKYRKTELTPEGTPVTKRYVDFCMNLDERTVDGFYYASVLKHFHKIMRAPSQLDNPPEEVLRDID